MHNRSNDGSAARAVSGKIIHRHPAVLRVSAIGVAGIMSALMVTAVAPPIVADQSDRAVVNAPVTLLTAPINGDIEQLSAAPGNEVKAGDALASITNARLDRATLISLEERFAGARQKLFATRAKRQSDGAYIASLETEISSQAGHLKAQLESQIEELRARVAQSTSMSAEKKALVDRQSSMVERNVASMDMLRPTSQQYSAALHNTAAENAKLNQKIYQLSAFNDGIYVGEDLVALNTLAQKKRDIELDAKRMDIEEKELSAVVDDLQHLIDAERERLERLAAAEVRSAGPGKIVSVGAALGRHVNAGDTIASLVDCDRAFVVAIFSYRQGQTMKVGSHVKIDGTSFRSGVVSAVLPKTSDKADENFAVPFPQTERRELYAVITPTQAAASDPQATTTGSPSTQPPACTVGQWVTVTRENGIVPSMSVAWRQFGNMVASWTADDAARKAESAFDPFARVAGIARLKAAFDSPSSQPGLKPDDDWLPRSRTFVSQ